MIIGRLILVQIAKLAVLNIDLQLTYNYASRVQNLQIIMKDMIHYQIFILPDLLKPGLGSWSGFEFSYSEYHAPSVIAQART